MNRNLAALSTLLLSFNVLPCFAQEHKGMPVTRVDNVSETLHGVSITDPYRWLENQYSSETRV